MSDTSEKSLQTDYSLLNETNQTRASSRFNQRRKAKGSSIVLNSKQLQRYEFNEDSENSNILMLMNEQLNSSDESQNIENDVSLLSNQNNSIDVDDIVYNNLLFENAASKLIRWYRKYRKIKSINFTHYLPILNDKMTDLLMSKLILGPRARKIFKSLKIQSLISTIKDIENVLLDIYLSDIINDESIASSPAVVIYRLEQIEKLMTNKDVDLSMSSSDILLIEATIKEYKKLKLSFHSIIFDKCEWVDCPSPGHWSLDASSCTSSTNHARIHKNKQKSSDIKNKAVKSPILTDDETIDIISNNIKKVEKKPNSMTQISKRKNNKAHLQLNIISADKLMPAKKGTASRDVYGEIIPDRKPGMKIELYLPNNSIISSPGNDKSLLKKMHQIIREYDVTTLNPRWDSTVYLPMISPKHLIIQAIHNWEQKNNQLAINNKLLDINCYEFICEELINYWSNGFIKIQIVDGERFNEEIFLGEVTILLSSFAVPHKSNDSIYHKYSTEISGSYVLNKITATDRVSGSLQLHIYLHIPEIDYILSIINPTFQSDTLDESIQNESFTEEDKSYTNTPSSNERRSHSKDKLKRLANKFQSTTSPSNESVGIKLDDEYDQRPNTSLGINERENDKESILYKVLNRKKSISKDDFCLTNSINNNIETKNIIANPFNKSKVKVRPSLSNVLSPINSRPSIESINRMEIIADVSKCLDNLSFLQSTDIVIDNMNKKILERNNRKISSKQENNNINNIL